MRLSVGGRSCLNGRPVVSISRRRKTLYADLQGTAARNERNVLRPRRFRQWHLKIVPGYCPTIRNEERHRFFPENVAWNVDWRCIGHAVINDLLPIFGDGAVTVKSAFQVSGLHKIVDPCFKVLIEAAGRMTPVIQEMA